MMSHSCRTCKKELPLESFRVRKDRTNYRVKSCRSCEKKENAILSRLHKTAPDKADACECCGEDTSLHLDHCHDSLSFRGWLCLKCNHGIGNLGDNISGLERALSYLRRKHL